MAGGHVSVDQNEDIKRPKSLLSFRVGWGWVTSGSVPIVTRASYPSVLELGCPVYLSAVREKKVRLHRMGGSDVP